MEGVHENEHKPLANQMLSAADHARVSAAVAQAEAHSAGEIVTIVAERSDDYADTPLRWAAVAALLTLGVCLAFPGFYRDIADRLAGGWNGDFSARNLSALLFGAVLLKFLFTYLVLQWWPLRMFFTLPWTKTERVHDRAVAFFKVGAERRTLGRTGVLIYLSVRERRAEIVADCAIASKVSAAVWGEAMATMISHVKDGHVADGMVAAVEQVGAVLREHFPLEGMDRNELPDRLIEV